MPDTTDQAPSGARRASGATAPADGRLDARPETPKRGIALSRPPRRRRRTGTPVSVWIASAWCTLICLSAVLAPLLPLHSPSAPDYTHVSSAPDSHHLLGTDQLGRDMLARLVYGGRASLEVGFFAVLLGMSIGLALGLLAGFFRGWVDAVVGIVADIALAFPYLVFVMVLVAVRGAGLGVLIVGLGIIMVPTFTRLARANTMTWSRRAFVTASEVLGARRLRTLLRDVFPNVLPSVLAYAFVVVAIAMVAEGSLSFLGLGLQPPTSSWGSMIAGGRQVLSTSPHQVLFPSLALLLTVLSFNVVGDYLRRKASGATDATV